MPAASMTEGILRPPALPKSVALQDSLRTSLPIPGPRTAQLGKTSIWNARSLGILRQQGKYLYVGLARGVALVSKLQAYHVLTGLPVVADGAVRTHPLRSLPVVLERFGLSLVDLLDETGLPRDLLA